MAVTGSATANGNVNGSGKLEEPDHSSSNWYFARDEIERRSPSRLDGIDLKKETYFRKSYCTFLQDLGMCLKVPQVTIATAIVFSHRFYLRQSHLKNDRFIIATICMFLAGKVEETPRPLRDVILMSYDIRHKKDPTAVARIKQKETFEEQKELVLVGERLVLTTLGFDLNIAHPYKPLVAAIKKLKVAQNALAQVAWNFVNDGLRTSLCLQFKPHHIAAGAIFLAAKFLKVKLPQDGDKVWWQEFEVTPRQLEEVSNQMLELYEQNKTLGPAPVPSGCRFSDTGLGTVTVNRVKGSDSVPSANGHHVVHHLSNAAGIDKTDKLGHTVKIDDVDTSTRRDELHQDSAITSAQMKQETGRSGPEAEAVRDNGSKAFAQDMSIEDTRTVKSVSNAQVKQEVKVEMLEQVTIGDGQMEEQVREKKLSTDFRVKTEAGTILRKTKVKTEMEDRKFTDVDGGFAREVTEAKSSLEEMDVEDVADSKSGVEVNMEVVKVKVEKEDEESKKLRASNIEDINTDRLKAWVEKRQKSKGEGLESKPATAKIELTDEEELLERELESGAEPAAAEAERVKQERRDFKSKSGQRVDHAMISSKKEGAEDVEAVPKRRRFGEEDGANDRKWTKSSERADRAEGLDGEPDRNRVGLSDRTEVGELPSSSHAYDQTRSPRQPDRRPVASGPYEKGSSPSSLNRHRDVHGRRDGYRDNRVGYGARERDYHQRDSHHRTDGERDRHHLKERDYQDRERKRGRVHELHGS
ncbi:unnamed protein product [Calypogeia fissa]